MPQHHSTEVTHLRPTTLCNHPHDGSVENCLTQALISIDPDTEELVFLSPAVGHYHHGHVSSITKRNTWYASHIWHRASSR